MNNKFTDEQYQQIRSMWKRNYYPPSSHNIDEWITWLSHQRADKDIKPLNEALTYLHDNHIAFKDQMVDLFNTRIQIDPQRNSIFNMFAFCTIFKFIKKHNLATDSEIPLDYIIHRPTTESVSRYYRENQIKLLVLFNPNEALVHKLLDFYTDIHRTYSIDLPEQKKIVNLFNSYAGHFVKTLGSEKQKEIFKKLDFICSGLNNESVKDVAIDQQQEYSFRFVISVNNSNLTCNMHFDTIKRSLAYVIDNIAKEQFSTFVFQDLNTNPKLGVLKAQYAFFSTDKEYIEQYNNYFKEFNELLVQDLTNKIANRGVEYYLELFNKICFKNKLLEKLPAKNNALKTHKI